MFQTRYMWGLTTFLSIICYNVQKYHQKNQTVANKNLQKGYFYKRILHNCKINITVGDCKSMVYE